MTGTPLLVASAAVALAVGCGNGKGAPVPVGNLMPPPPGELCVEASPADATVKIDGEVRTEPCVEVQSYGTHAVEVSAPGYVTQTTEESVAGHTVLWVELVPEGDAGTDAGSDAGSDSATEASSDAGTDSATAADQPRVTPKPPPPVGNLMPPPRLRPPEKKP